MSLRLTRGRAYRLADDNIDTDQIIPARHLKTLSRKGLGQYAFEGLRIDPDNPFDDPQLCGAPILIAGENFGCGSSREHAVWALMDLGIRVVLAKSFSDIFAGNALKRGLAAIALEPRAIELLLEQDNETDVTIDLEAMEVHSGTGIFAFAIDPFRREWLVRGLDEISLTLGQENKIAAFEHQRPEWLEARARKLH